MKYKSFTIASSALVLSMMLLANLMASIETITVKVDNLACRFCSQGIAKKLLDLKSVRNVTFNEQNKAVHMVLSEKNTFNLGILKELIERNTHYVIRDIKITATGKIIRKGKFFALDIENNPRLIYLEEIAQVVANKPLVVQNEQEDPKKKKTHGFVASTKRAWDKTSDFVKNIISGSNKVLQNSLSLFCDQSAPVRYCGSIHRHADETFWGSPTAHVKEIRTSSSLEGQL